MAKKVFISYSHRNKKECQNIAEVLESKLGLEVWYDKELLPGEVYRNRIVEKIKESHFFVLLLSEYSVQSEWVLDELEYAKKKKLTIIPLSLEGVVLPDTMDMLLQRYNIISYSDDPEVLESEFLRTIPMDDEMIETLSKASIGLEEDGQKKDTITGAASNGSIERASKKKTSDKEKNGRKNKKKIPIWGWILAAVVLIAVLIGGNKLKNRDKTRAAAIMPTSIFWGTKSVEEEKYSYLTAGSDLIHLKAGGQELELSPIPSRITVIPEWGEDVMILEFLDKNGKKYSIYGNFTCSLARFTETASTAVVNHYVESVTVSPIDPAKDNDKIDSQYKIEQSYTFKVKVNGNGYFFVLSQEGNKSVEMNVEPHDEIYGRAMTEHDMLDDISAMYLNGATQEALLVYGDKSYSANAGCNVSANTNSITVKSEGNVVIYNGEAENSKRSSTKNYQYIDTYPYGFIIWKDDRLYCYQSTELIAQDEMLNAVEGVQDPVQLLRDKGLLEE